MSINFSTAEELDHTKHEIKQQRIRKLTQDRQSPHGNSKFAQTDGLKTIRPRGNGKRNQTIVIDGEFELDPRRIRKLSDLVTDDKGIDE